MFVFPSKLGKNAALVRGCSPIFAPTVAKTVAILATSVDGQVGLYTLGIVPVYKEGQPESSHRSAERHDVPTRLKHRAAEAGKEVAEALRDIAVMVAGEAAKRAIWG